MLAFGFEVVGGVFDSGDDAAEEYEKVGFPDYGSGSRDYGAGGHGLVGSAGTEVHLVFFSVMLMAH